MIDLFVSKFFRTEMKSFIKIFFTLFLFLTTCNYSDAQSVSVATRTPEQEAKMQTEKMKRDLKLSKEQVRKVYKINLKYAKLRRISNTRKEAIKRIKKKNDEIFKLLTKEQQKIFLEKKRNRYHKPKHRKKSLKRSNARNFLLLFL